MGRQVKLLKPAVPMWRGCLHAGPAPQVCPLTRHLAVGFGAVSLTRDGQVVWTGDEAFKRRPKNVRWAENRAAADPAHDWRLRFESPLSGELFQRHAPGRWVLVKQDRGFA